MSEDRFSYQVEEYFRKRGTYPVTLTFKNQQVTEEMLSELEERVYEEVDDNDGIKIIASEFIRGDFWSGILIELNKNEFDSCTTPTSWDTKTLHKTLLNIYDEFDELDTRVIGFSAGSSAYPVAALESLGQDYFIN